MEKEIKEINNLRSSLTVVLLFSFLYTMIVYHFVSKRLDAHKQVIELQQKQINQLIIHCEYERNK